VISATPPPNHILQWGTNIELTFSCPVDPASVAGGTYKFHGEQTGRFGGVPTLINTDKLSFAATPLVKADEKLDFFVDGLRSVSGMEIQRYRQGFRADVSPMSGEPLTWLWQQPSFGEWLGWTYVATDVDGDLDVDIVTYRLSNQPTDGNVYTNDGAGHFQFLGTPGFRAVDKLVPAVLGDNDLADLVVQSQGVVSIWTNDGAGTFAQSSGFAITASGFDVGDVNGDGYLDIVVFTTQMGATPQFYAGAPGGGFVAEPLLLANWNTGYSTMRTVNIALDDLDGDGFLDLLILANETTNLGQTRLLEVHVNRGGNYFEEQSSIPTTLSAIRETADLDGDGDVDVIVDDTIFLNLGDGRLLPTGALTGFRSMGSTRMAPQMGRQTHAARSSGAQVRNFFEYTTLKPFESSSLYQFLVVGYSTGIVTADFDGDGLVDVGAAQVALQNYPRVISTSPVAYSNIASSSHLVELTFSHDMDTSVVPSSGDFLLEGEFSGLHNLTSSWSSPRKLLASMSRPFFAGEKVHGMIASVNSADGRATNPFQWSYRIAAISGDICTCRTTDHPRTRLKARTPSPWFCRRGGGQSWQDVRPRNTRHSRSGTPLNWPTRLGPRWRLSDWAFPRAR